MIREIYEIRVKEIGALIEAPGIPNGAILDVEYSGDVEAFCVQKFYPWQSKRLILDSVLVEAKSPGTLFLSFIAKKVSGDIFPGTKPFKVKIKAA
jgi:hypothetical protein